MRARILPHQVLEDRERLVVAVQVRKAAGEIVVDLGPAAPERHRALERGHRLRVPALPLQRAPELHARLVPVGPCRARALQACLRILQSAGPAEQLAKLEPALAVLRMPVDREPQHIKRVFGPAREVVEARQRHARFGGRRLGADRLLEQGRSLRGVAALADAIFPSPSRATPDSGAAASTSSNACAA